MVLEKMQHDIVSSLLNHKTSLGVNPAIPDVLDTPFLYYVSNKQYLDLLEKVKEMGIYSIDDAINEHGRLLSLCKKAEQPFKNLIEQIALNVVIDIFSIPEDSVSISASLVDSIDSISNMPVDAVISTENEMLLSEIDKRRMLNCLAVGGALDIASKTSLYKDAFDDIDEMLPKYYKRFMILNSFILFTKENDGISDKNYKQLGFSEVTLGLPDEIVKIESKGVIFPVLLFELIKAFFELFNSHGLPERKSDIVTVLDGADYLKAEPWDMRLGPKLWALLVNSFNDINSDELPYLLKRIATLDIDDFNFILKEVFAETKLGRNLMSKLSNKAKKDKDYTKFVAKMDKIRNDKSIITDDISPEEL